MGVVVKLRPYYAYSQSYLWILMYICLHKIIELAGTNGSWERSTNLAA
jgi:hypothetical protein